MMQKTDGRNGEALWENRRLQPKIGHFSKILKRLFQKSIFWENELYFRRYTDNLCAWPYILIYFLKVFAQKGAA